MPALHIRNVDDAVVTSLKRRATENKRSLEGELRELLRQAALSWPSSPNEGRRRTLKLKLVSVGSRSAYGRDEIYGDEES